MQRQGLFQTHDLQGSKLNDFGAAFADQHESGYSGHAPVYLEQSQQAALPEFPVHRLTSETVILETNKSFVG